ncbi:MAG TPA: hypothetical protein V6C52_09475 [Coleofasciculaceae cyanobacterium]|jgi:hypothetical protein
MTFYLNPLLSTRQTPPKSAGLRFSGQDLTFAQTPDTVERLPSGADDLYSNTYPTFPAARDAFIDYAIHRFNTFKNPYRQAPTCFPPSSHRQPQVLRTEKSPWELPSGAFPEVKLAALSDLETDKPLIEIYASRHKPFRNAEDHRTQAEMPIQLLAKYHDHPEGLTTDSVLYYPQTGKIL